MRYDLLVLGEALTVLVPENGAAFRRAESVHRQTAGAEINVAVSVARLGLRSGFIGRIGADLAGEAIIDDIRRESVDVLHVIVDNEAPTGLIIREMTPSGSRVSYLRQGSAGSRLQPRDLKTAVLHEARALHISGVTAAVSESARDTAKAAFHAMHEYGAMTSFDLNYRSRLWTPDVAAPVLRELALGHRLLVGGSDEMNMVFGTDDPVALHDITGCRLVVVTRGSDDVMVADEAGAWQAAVRPAAEVDVVGAGDALVGGVIAALLAGASNREAVDQGIRCGTAVVQRLGDWSGLPWGVDGILPQTSGAVNR